MSEVKDFKFDKMALSYDTGLKGKVLKRFYKLLISQIEIAEDAVVLDVGCGTGSILKMMSEIADIDGYGIDIEENMINEAKQKCPSMNIQISNCNDTPFENSKFDIITVCLAFHHFADKKGFAQEAVRILKPDGHLYITDPKFPVVIRKPVNLAFRIHRIAGYFGSSKELAAYFDEFGLSLLSVTSDKYAQCLTLQKVS